MDAVNGFCYILCDHFQRVVCGYTILNQVDASGCLYALQILGEQVAQANLYALSSKVCGNGCPAVARANATDVSIV